MVAATVLAALTSALPATPTASASPPSGAAPPAPGATAPPVPPAKAWILVDVDTHRALAGDNQDAPLPPASLTKMLTALIAVNWLPADATVAADPQAAAVTPDRVGMAVGQPWPLQATLEALLVVSANDAAYALAERVSGSVAAFGATMTTAAATLGLADHPVLHDPAGLDGTDGVDGGNLVSARDLAVVAMDLLADPVLAPMVALQHFVYTSPSGTVYGLRSHDTVFLRSYAGAVGVKTGYTSRAGACIAAAATRGGRTMLAVVLGGAATDQTAERLLDDGFATPVAAEASDLQLPPDREPAPAPPAAPPTTHAAATARIAAGASASAPVRSNSGAGPGGWAGWAGGAAVVAVVAASGGLVRRRHRPAHGPRR